MDRQKSKTYRWEVSVVAPHDITPVPFDQIEMIVKHVWEQEGLEYPPLVKRLNKKCRKGSACAKRTKLKFHSETYTWIILHEMAHAMTMLSSGESNGHGSLFMGIFCQLLSRYLGFNFVDLVKTAQDAGLRVKPDASPVFLEK
jgi:hypothetical protein